MTNYTNQNNESNLIAAIAWGVGLFLVFAVYVLVTC